MDTHAKDDAVLAGLIKIDMVEWRSAADATEGQVEIPLDCVVASVGQSQITIRLGGELSIPQKGYRDLPCFLGG